MGFIVLVGFARDFGSLPLTRAGVQAGLASLLLLAGAGSVQDATALGETRTLSFHHTHSDEDLTVTFKRNGRYDEDGLKQINHFLRDWRSQDQTTMDRHLFDILWEVYRDVDGKQPIQIISAYRSPATNAMLRRRSSGVARFSQHMLGHAMDFFIPGIPLEQIRFAGLRLQRGGVGFYPTSGSPRCCCWRAPGPCMTRPRSAKPARFPSTTPIPMKTLRSPSSAMAVTTKTA